MSNSWSRDNTRDWINQIESRLEDMHYYLEKSMMWCEHNGIYENSRVLMCSLITCIWVASMRNEPISFREIVEIMGLTEFEDSNLDKIYGICNEFQILDHEEILSMLIDKTGDWSRYLPS